MWLLVLVSKSQIGEQIKLMWSLNNSSQPSQVFSSISQYPWRLSSHAVNSVLFLSAQVASWKKIVLAYGKAQRSLSVCVHFLLFLFIFICFCAVCVEPVWAVGTGIVATPQQVERMRGKSEEGVSEWASESHSPPTTLLLCFLVLLKSQLDRASREESSWHLRTQSIPLAVLFCLSLWTCAGRRGSSVCAFLVRHSYRPFSCCRNKNHLWRFGSCFSSLDSCQMPPLPSYDGYSSLVSSLSFYFIVLPPCWSKEWPRGGSVTVFNDFVHFFVRFVSFSFFGYPSVRKREGKQFSWVDAAAGHWRVPLCIFLMPRILSRSAM